MGRFTGRTRLDPVRCAFEEPTVSSATTFDGLMFTEIDGFPPFMAGVAQ
jgi:hypothetical protein